MKFQENLSKEEKKMMRSVFWRSWTMNASRTGATQYHAVGVIYTLLPVINRFYQSEGRACRGDRPSHDLVQCNDAYQQFHYGISCIYGKTK